MWITPIKTPDGEFDKYAIDDYGLILSFTQNRKKFLRADVGDKGYMRYTLSGRDGKLGRYLIHRLVMMNFDDVPNSDKLDVNHISGEKADNRFANLEWVTKSENMNHALQHNLVDYSHNGTHFKKVSDENFENILHDIFIKQDAPVEIAKRYNVSAKYVRDVRMCRHRKPTILKFMERNNIKLTERQAQRLSKWCRETRL